jgi:hypothetical protein
LKYGEITEAMDARQGASPMTKTKTYVLYGPASPGGPAVTQAYGTLAECRDEARRLYWGERWLSHWEALPPYDSRTDVGAYDAPVYGAEPPDDMRFGFLRARAESAGRCGSRTPRARGRVTPWTDDEDGILTAAHAEGRTDREIAALLRDRTETAARKRRQRLGLVYPVAGVDRARLAELHAAGATTREIAAVLECTYRTAQELLHRAGLKAHRTPRTPVLDTAP